MDCPDVTVSAPGSLMLLGEHAVLHGHRALVCAIDRRIKVGLFKSPDAYLRIVSDLGKYQAPLDDLVDHPSFRFVLEAVRRHLDKTPCGFELRIDSEFPPDIGFGSSAAVTVATHAAILHWLTGKAPAPEILFSRSLETVHAVQERGSGADIAASVFGGIVAYTNTPSFEPLEVALPLTAVYCGYKTPTPEVILKIDRLRAADPEKYRRIFTEIDESVGDAVVYLRSQDLPAFGSILDRNHQLMDEMGVNTPELQEIVEKLRNDPGIFGAKISGSGLGDCAVGIGCAGLSDMDYPVHHLEITPDGCIMEA